MKKFLSILLVIALAASLVVSASAEGAGYVLKTSDHGNENGFFRIDYGTAPSSWESYTVEFDFKWISNTLISTCKDYVIFSAFDGTAYNGGMIQCTGGKVQVTQVAGNKVYADDFQMEANTWYNFKLTWDADANLSITVDGTLLSFGGNTKLTPNATTLNQYFGYCGDLSGGFSGDKTGAGSCVYGEGNYDGVGYWDNIKAMDGDKVLYESDIEADAAEAEKVFNRMGATTIGTTYPIAVNQITFWSLVEVFPFRYDPAADSEHKYCIVPTYYDLQGGCVRLATGAQPEGDNWSLFFDIYMQSYKPDIGADKWGGKGFTVMNSYDGKAYTGAAITADAGIVSINKVPTEFKFEPNTWYTFEIRYEGATADVFVNGTAIAEDVACTNAPSKKDIGFFGDLSGSEHNGCAWYDNFKIVENGKDVWTLDFESEAQRDQSDTTLWVTVTSSTEIATDIVSLDPWTEPEVEDKEEDKEEVPPTGDNMIAFAILGTVALAGVAIASKKR